MHERQCSVPCVAHAAPLAAVPPEHVHWFMAQPLSEENAHEPVRCWPAGHVRHALQP